MTAPLLTLSVALCAALSAPVPPAESREFVSRHIVDEEFDRRLNDAKANVRALWDLVVWCEDTDREQEVAKVYQAVLRLDPDDARARAGLGHVELDGQWFTSEKKLAEHMRTLESARAKELGLVKYRGDWVAPDDVPNLKRGMVRDADGRWLTKREKSQLDDGWQRQDLLWVSPDDVAQIEAGLWKCGEEWLPLAEADRYHSRFEQCWVIPTPNMTVWTNCGRATAEKAIEEMERGIQELARIYGKKPPAPIPVALLRRSAELEAFCERGIGDYPPAEGRALVKGLRAVFAESWFDDEQEQWRGAGASFWDASDANGDKFGVHDARMAVGLSFADALDPSSKVVEKFLKRRKRVGFVDAFYDAKTLPAWFGWGAATYASRYYRDVAGDGSDPWWAREWSVQNLRNRGGIGFLRPVFEMDLAADPKDASRLALAAGLLVAFMVDGECEPVSQVHAQLIEALRSGAPTEKIFEQLRMELEKHEDELRAFARL